MFRVLFCAGLNDIIDHSLEDEIMKWQHGVPVQPAKQTPRAERCRLHQHVFIVFFVEFKFQPGLKVLWQGVEYITGREKCSY